jgi:integrase/recombinase XerD
MQTALAHHIDWYLGFLAARPASSRTIATYRSALGRLERFAGSQALDADLLRAAAVDYMAEGARSLEADEPTRTKGNEGGARIMVIAARGMVKALRKSGNVSVCDLSSVETPRVPERLQPRVDLADYARLCEALARRAAYPRYPRYLLARDSALVLFLFETGLRASEASRLNVADVDLNTGEVRIHQAKSRKARRLGISDPDDETGCGGETVRRLRAYLVERAKQPETGLRQRALWLGARGKRLSPASMRVILRDLCAEAGMSNLPVHAFRRGWFTVAYRSEPRDLPILAARMGWSQHSTRMVAVYTRGAMLDLAAMPRPLVSRTCYARQGREA